MKVFLSSLLLGPILLLHTSSPFVSAHLSTPSIPPLLLVSLTLCHPLSFSSTGRRGYYAGIRSQPALIPAPEMRSMLWRVVRFGAGEALSLSKSDLQIYEFSRVAHIHRISILYTHKWVRCEFGPRRTLIAARREWICSGPSVLNLPSKFHNSYSINIMESVYSPQQKDKCSLFFIDWWFFYLLLLLFII